MLTQLPRDSIANTLVVSDKSGTDRTGQRATAFMHASTPTMVPNLAAETSCWYPEFARRWRFRLRWPVAASRSRS
eukprot:9843731-Lingulodinium_polyedra.AAC.2